MAVFPNELFNVSVGKHNNDFNIDNPALWSNVSLDNGNVG